MKITELMELLREKGVKTIYFRKEELNKVKRPLVVKADTTEHKTDKKLVFLNLCNDKDIEKAINEIQSAGYEPIIQPMISGIEVIVGYRVDETFGPVVMFGAGGIFTEIYRDVAFRKWPTDKEELKKMINETKISAIFHGFRGKCYNIDEVVNAISAIAEIANEKGFREMEINPLIINEEGAFAVDVRAV